MNKSEIIDTEDALLHQAIEESMKDEQKRRESMKKEKEKEISQTPPKPGMTLRTYIKNAVVVREWV